MPLNRGLVIEVVNAEGWAPWSSYRGQNVGVGGRYLSGPFAGGPVRRATQRELRHLDRCTILKALKAVPGGTIRFRRTGDGL